MDGWETDIVRSIFTHTITCTLNDLLMLFYMKSENNKSFCWSTQPQLLKRFHCDSLSYCLFTDPEVLMSTRVIIPTRSLHGYYAVFIFEEIVGFTRHPVAESNKQTNKQQIVREVQRRTQTRKLDAFFCFQFVNIVKIKRPVCKPFIQWSTIHPFPHPFGCSF